MSRTTLTTWKSAGAVGALVILAAVLAAGCNFAPKYKKPDIDTPLAYKETNGWKMAEPSDAKLKGKWWEMFNDSQLNTLEEQVVVSNQTIKAALENFLASRAIAKQAKAGLFPTVSAEPSYTKTQPSKNTSQGGSSLGLGSNSTGGVSVGSGIYSSYSLPLDASWEPDLWGSIRNTVKASVASAQASAAQLENMRLTMQAELAVDYYELRAQDELIDLYSNTIVNYKSSLDLTTKLFQTGIDSDLDVAQADSLLQTTLAQATALDVPRAQYEHAIAVLLGQPPSTFTLKIERHPTKPPEIPVGMPANLLERRPDIASAERAVAQANANIGVARAAFFPTLSLTGGTGFQSSTMSKLLQSGSFYWAVGAAATETIFDAGKRKAVTEQAWDNYRANVATYRQSVLTAFQQVEDNIASLRILEREIHQEDVAVKAAQKSVDLSIQRYRLGITSYLNVITAQVSLLNNQQTAVTIRNQQMTAAVQLIIALGGGWDSDELPTQKKVMHGTANPEGTKQ